MPALIDLRKRIKSVRNTQQITQAMKTVSTVKFQKAQRLVLESRPKWHDSPELVQEAALWAPRSSHPLLERREEKKIVGLVITSDKGLAGAFNSNLLDEASSFFAQKAETAGVRIILIGKKALLFFKKTEYPILRSYSGRAQRFTEEDCSELAQFLMEIYILNKADAVYVAYNEFKSILAPRVIITKLLPVELFGDEKDAEGSKEKTAHIEQRPDWDPAMLPLVHSLLPQHVEDQIAHFFFESSAAEHAARMMAMDNATQNAEELIEDLTLVLNKIRQASITKELLEIMSAVEALAKK
ncbi:MAG: ATP synthase F1 subunit gamma [Candidatus Aminicenantes bacterium]|jgi:F-type H+-transporting ATPase subunit gamma